MAAKMRYMGYIALTTHQASHGQIEQREPEGSPQSRREWGQIIREWRRAFGFGRASRPGHTVAQSRPHRLAAIERHQ